VGRWRKRREIASHATPVARGPVLARSIMIARIGAKFWLIPKMQGGTMLDDAAAVQAAIKTGVNLGTFDTLAKAADAMRHWLPADV
jgi:hypothetical protein